MSGDRNTRKETHNHTPDKEMGEGKETGKDRAEEKKKRVDGDGKQTRSQKTKVEKGGWGGRRSWEPT